MPLVNPLAPCALPLAGIGPHAIMAGQSPREDALRTHIFHSGYWVITVMMGVLVVAPATLIPGRWATVGAIWLYTRALTGWMALCGLKLLVRRLHVLPDTEPAVLASKHQSWGDGICLVSRHRELTYVIGDHMLKYPLVGWILRRLEAVVVDNAGGKRTGGGFDTGLEALKRSGRDVLIYPEGGLSQVGTKKRYRLGVYRLARELGRPVIPVATNLGVFWPQQKWEFHPGLAIIELLDPIHPGDDPKAFIAALEAAIETRTAELVKAGLRGRR
ncbi:MAG: 1-acyl-sn-glycerol-3-phosphate acyltransferase [Oceanicaulis sp. HLUCCA04]|nr:MAG: 1-acyl-sn-glycerol-3-phosphate acyltransferase [Oceanicaulis sp. HLUCCA04]